MDDAVDAFHRDEPLRAGITVELLRQTVPTHDQGRLADVLLSEAVASGTLEVRDSSVSRPGYEPVITDQQRMVMDQLLDLYREAGLAAPMVSELPETFRDRDDLWPLLKLLESRGRLVALENELFMEAEGFAAAAERVAIELAGATGLGPSDFRKVLPVTRKHLIPILSHFDQTGLTTRGPDGRNVATREPK
jgi:selenocysteine-specific elongation factor